MPSGEPVAGSADSDLEMPPPGDSSYSQGTLLDPLVVEPFRGYDLPQTLEEWSEQIRYEIGPGDTLDSIAARHGSSVSAIIALNGITDHTHLFFGEFLVIPVGYVDTVDLPPVGARAALQSWPRIAEYTIRSGDSLEAVAREFLTSSEAIALFNEIQTSAPPPVETTLQVPWGFTLDVSGGG